MNAVAYSWEQFLQHSVAQTIGAKFLSLKDTELAILDLVGQKQSTELLAALRWYV